MTRPSQLAQFQHTQLQGQPLSIIIAAGPFTLDTDLDYEPLDALMEVVRDDRPDALILVGFRTRNRDHKTQTDQRRRSSQLGPFVDSAHPKIKAGDVDKRPVEIFREQIGDRISSFVESCPGTQIIMIPSVRDLVSRHVAFPQANLEKERMVELGLPKVSLVVVCQQREPAKSDDCARHSHPASPILAQPMLLFHQRNLVLHVDGRRPVPLA